MDRFTINQNLLCEPKIKLAEWQHLYLRPRCRDQPLAAGDDACLRCNISVCVLQSSRYVFLPLSSRDALMSLSVYCTLRLAHTRAYTKTEDSTHVVSKANIQVCLEQRRLARRASVPGHGATASQRGRRSGVSTEVTHVPPRPSPPRTCSLLKARRM